MKNNNWPGDDFLKKKKKLKENDWSDVINQHFEYVHVKTNKLHVRFIVKKRKKKKNSFESIVDRSCLQ